MTLAQLEDELSALDAIYGEESKFKYDPKSHHVFVSFVEERAEVMVDIFDFEAYPEDPPKYQIVNAHNVDEAALSDQITSLLHKYKGGEVLFDLDLELTAWLKLHSAPAISMFEMRQREQGQGANDKTMVAQETPSSSEDESDDSSIPEGRQDLEVGRLEEITLVDESERCTEEQFMAWKNAFRQEMIETGVWKDINAVSDKKSGKELFQTNSLKGGKLEPQLDASIGNEEVFCFQEGLYAEDQFDPDFEDSDSEET